MAVSLFVNPPRFAQGEDFHRYSRNEQADIAAAGQRGAHLVLLPSAEEMFAPDFAARIEVTGVKDGLESLARPGFFSGVARLVGKLLPQSPPDISVFGGKDYQQLPVIRRLVRDLDLPVSVLSCPTVRDLFGLALSSRTVNLTEKQMPVARRLFEVLRMAGKRIGAGEKVAEELAWGEARLPAAVRTGDVRLIDNVAVIRKSGN